MNAQLEARRREFNEEASAVDALLSEAISTKNYKGLAALENRVEAMAGHRAQLEADEMKAKALANHPLSQLGGSAADLGAQPTVTTKAMTGAQVSPLAFPEEAMKSLHAAVASKTSLSIKAFSTV